MAPTVLQNGNRSRTSPIPSVSRQAQREIFSMPCRFRQERFLARFEMTPWALTGGRLALLLIVIASVLFFSASPGSRRRKDPRRLPGGGSRPGAFMGHRRGGDLAEIWLGRGNHSRQRRRARPPGIDQQQRSIFDGIRYRCHHRALARSTRGAIGRDDEHARLVAAYPTQYPVGARLERKNARHLARARRELHTACQAAARSWSQPERRRQVLTDRRRRGRPIIRVEGGSHPGNDAFPAVGSHRQQRRLESPREVRRAQLRAEGSTPPRRCSNRTAPW